MSPRVWKKNYTINDTLIDASLCHLNFSECICLTVDYFFSFTTSTMTKVAIATTSACTNTPLPTLNP